MDASVIVSTYNRARLLEGALTALTGQKTPPGLAWDVIAVDNNSRDDTRALVEREQATSPVRVTYAFEGQQGQSYAVNHGIGLASGDVFAFTGDDCRPESTWLADVLAALDTWDVSRDVGHPGGRPQLPPRVVNLLRDHDLAAHADLDGCHCATSFRSYSHHCCPSSPLSGPIGRAKPLKARAPVAIAETGHRSSQMLSELGPAS